MEFTSWLRAWLTQHPLKAPTGLARYTAEVMAKVRALAPHAVHSTSLRTASRVGSRDAAPARSRWGWELVPRLSLGLATAAAALLLVMRLASGPQPQVATRVAPAVDQDAGRLIRLAESSPRVAADSWIEETLQLLQELDEELPEDAIDDEELSEEEWFDELDSMDQAENALAAQS